MNQITLEQVSKSYNGKSGCMCGCNGNYTLPSHASIERANRVIGYNAYDESNVSDRRVNTAVRKINEALDKYNDQLENGEYSKDGYQVGRTNEFAYVNDGNRNTVVYF